MKRAHILNKFSKKHKHIRIRAVSLSVNENCAAALITYTGELKVEKTEPKEDAKEE